MYNPSCQDSDAGLLLLEPALTTFAKSKIPSFSGFIPRIVLADVQANLEAEGFCVMRGKRVPTLAGQRFTRLVVIAEKFPPEVKTRICDVVCDCGTKKEVLTWSLRGGHTLSCGCLARELSRARPHGTHRLTRTPEYRVFNSMMNRVDNPDEPSYKNYGGRGITVCMYLRTMSGFAATLGQRPSPDFTIERENNDSGYWCGECSQCIENGWTRNVRWATRAEQSRNKRNNVWITINGETKCLEDWAKESPVGLLTIRTRRAKGMSDRDAVFLPANVGRSLRERATEAAPPESGIK